MNAEINKNDVLATIKQQIADNAILLYMKGDPSIPQCGFSATAVKILQACGRPFATVNILQHSSIRQVLPEYANWPTFPQLYINSELIGGSDIMLEMYEEGELQKIINEVEVANDSSSN